MASNTVLSLTSSAWTLVLGRPGVAFRTRVLAVALCISAGFGDDSDKTQSVFMLYSGGETFEFPDPAPQLWPLALNAVVGTNPSDVVWAHTVVLTSPVTATLGLSLTIPIAMVGDWLLAKLCRMG